MISDRRCEGVGVPSAVSDNGKDEILLMVLEQPAMPCTVDDILFYPIVIEVL